MMIGFVQNIHGPIMTLLSVIAVLVGLTLIVSGSSFAPPKQALIRPRLIRALWSRIW